MTNAELIRPVQMRFDLGEITLGSENNILNQEVNQDNTCIFNAGGVNINLIGQDNQNIHRIFNQ
jgi:hypothetical protein